MELMHKEFIGLGILLMIIVACVCVVITYLWSRHTKPAKSIRKVANADFIRKLPEYKLVKYVYAGLAIVFAVLLTASAIMSLVLAARPTKMTKTSAGVKKRDIFLCLDISYSVYDQNYELVDEYEDVVKRLDGDRFGITLFNTSTIMYVPMTDDSEYIIQKLEELKEYFLLQKRYEELLDEFNNTTEEISDEKWDEYFDVSSRLTYFDSASLVNNQTKGSSLIGEGLGTCLYSFPHIEDKERTRVIILSTDNDQYARLNPVLELQDACDICQKYDVKVYGVFPSRELFIQDDIDKYDDLYEDFEKSIESTDGICYVPSKVNTMSSIVQDIEEHEALQTDELVITRNVDVPEKAISILMLVAGLMVMVKILLTV